jgi:hypothetical protein
MNDDIRTCLELAHSPMDEQELLPDGGKRKPRRWKVMGVRGASLRVRSVRGGKYLVIEGSYNGFLQGHNVIGSMNLHELVQKVIRRVLRRLRLVPSREEKRAIKAGRIKLERLDLVGYLKVDHLGGPSAILKALDTGLAGSQENRMVFPGETLVYHSHSKHWSLMAYDKAEHLITKHPETWGALDPRIQEIARTHLRFELRQFRRELVALGWLEVRDVNVEQLKEQFAARLNQLMGDLRHPFPALPLPQGVGAPPVAYMRALLASLGYDFSASLSERAQRDERKKLKDGYGIDRRCSTDLPLPVRRTLRDLKRRPAFPIRHGAPRTLRER